MNTSIIIQLIPLLIIAAIMGFIVNQSRRNGAYFGKRIIVRCNQGHLFSTLWIPFVSAKAIRLGPIRIQYCPIGNHLAFVAGVNVNSLTEEEKDFAENHPDSMVP